MNRKLTWAVMITALLSSSAPMLGHGGDKNAPKGVDSVEGASITYSSDVSDYSTPAYRRYWKKLFDKFKVKEGRPVLLLLQDDSDDVRGEGVLSMFLQLKDWYGADGKRRKGALEFATVNVNSQREYVQFFGPRLMSWDHSRVNSVILFISSKAFTVQRYEIEHDAALQNVMLDIGTLVEVSKMVLTSREMALKALDDTKKPKVILWTKKVGYDFSWNEIEVMRRLKQGRIGKHFNYYIIIQDTDASRVFSDYNGVIPENHSSTFVIYSDTNRESSTKPVSFCTRGVYDLLDRMEAKMEFFVSSDLGNSVNTCDESDASTDGIVNDIRQAFEEEGKE